MRQRKIHSILVRVFSLILILILLITSFEHISVKAPAQASSTDEITLILTGDIMTARSVEREIEEHDDYYFPFRGIGKFTKQGDITFGNLETCISERGEPLDKMYTFRAKSVEN